MTRPPDLPLPMAGTLVLVVLTFAPTLTPTGAQTTTSTASSSSWTFSEPGVSHISFSPPLSDSKVLTLEMSFRTLQPNGLLVYQDVPEYDEVEEAEEVTSLLASFHLVVEMSQGHLRVGHMFDHYKDILNIGRALNDNKWHKRTLVLNQTNGEMSVTLDTNSATQFLQAYIWGNARDVLDWSRLQTSLQLGGVRGPRSQEYASFIGCFRDMKYSTDGAILQDIPVGVKEGVTPGCIDRCQGGDRCKNNGRCVNLYTDFECDCFGTDYEGRTCEKQGPSVLTFSGYEWVTYQLYQGEENRLFSDHNRVALEFKTERPAGILLYAVGWSPYHNHITATLHSGALRVSVAFGNDDLDFPLGIGLDDNRWHNLTIEHSGRQVSVYLDGDVTSRTVKNTDFFLSLDPLAYIGGGDNFVITRGLPVTRNFVGCMKNVYFNDHSVLYKLSSGSDICRYHGGESPTFGCSPVQDIPISFPNAASVLHWSLGSRDENLTVDFQFRTVREDGILFYVELLSRRDGGSQWDMGWMEAWIIKGHPMLMFIPSNRNEQFSENITLPSVVNDKQWHSMHIELKQSQAKLKVDAVSRSTHQYGKSLLHKGQVILGFGLRGYRHADGYVGCMEQIVIQGKKLDPISVVESGSAIGLKLDGCYLVDYCSINNICEHDSRCLSDWDGVQCDCEGKSYEGKACHFPRYPATCDAYYQAGHTESGVYLIDVDRHGTQEPTHVECAMGSQRNGHLYGATMVEHNFAIGTPVRGSLLEDRRYDLTYREMSRVQLMALGERSASCEQYFKYTCQNSPILLGKKTWFKSADGQVVDYLGVAKSGFCTCPDSDDGTCDGKRCYCDHNDAEPTQDEGYSHNKQQLPIMELTFLQNRSSPGVANMTLGPLTCWGNDKQRLDNLVTLTTEESHLKLHTWKGGDLGLHFKTHHDHALLLMQTSSDTEFGNKFTIKIVSENSVEFYFSINGTVIHERLRTPRPVNQGDWHYIFIEHDRYNVRLSLDTTRKLVLLDSAITGVVDFNSIMYIGGLPDDVASSYSETTPGFSGCIRAFLYNNQEVELSMLVDGSMSGVSTGCMSSCWPNPCQHGGTCQEDWGEYTCQCQDPWAHQGHNCEHNLNTDAVTFSGETSSYLTFDLSKQPSPLDQTIVLSFRTFQSDALLFYAYDHLSNFVQMELQQGDTILFTYNTYRTIVSGSLTAPEPLNDGQWKQVVALEYYNLTKLILEDQSKIIEYKRIKLNTYSLDPFKDSIQPESVFIARSYEEPAPFVRLFVGGVGDGGTAIPFLKGCVRGMRVGIHHVNLRQAAQARGNTSDLTDACDTGCHEDTCLNNGYCNEHWRYGNFTCDCSETDFAGKICEKEASVLLKGQSVLKHTFRLPLSAQRSVTEEFSLHFRITGTGAVNEKGERMHMALIYIKSTESQDYILARVDSDGSVQIETNQGVGIYRMKVTGNYASGDLHELLYKREGSNMYLTVRPLDSMGSWILDGVREASIVYPDYDLDKIDTIIIGGLLMDDENSFENTGNFSGCISNTVFIPAANLGIKLRSLKNFYQDNSDVKVYGPEVDSCSADMLVGKMVTDAPDSAEVTSASFEMLTMPTWDVGPARLVTLSPPVVLTAPPITTIRSTTTTNRTRAVMVQSQERTVDDLTVIIAVSVIAGILVIALIIALLLFHKRRRHYDVKKEADIELKQPLNFHAVAPVQSSPVPADHLAKLDEFSMISAMLGPRPTANAVVPNNIDSNSNRHSQGSMPKADEGVTFEHPIFNKRKQRPASSISEVLEELERRQNSRNSGSSENIVGRPHGEGELEWDPQADRTPLTYEDITFFNTPLLAPIPDENEDSHVSSLSGQNSDLKEKPEESIPSADESQGNQNSMLEGNGDSGYEAESRPEVTEDDVTPTGDNEDLEEEDDTTHPKLYMYNISNIDLEDSPVLTSPSRRLLGRSSRDT